MNTILTKFYQMTTILFTVNLQFDKKRKNMIHQNIVQCDKTCTSQVDYKTPKNSFWDTHMMEARNSLTVGEQPWTTGRQFEYLISMCLYMRYDWSLHTNRLLAANRQN